MIELPWFGIFVGSYLVWVVLACTSLLMNRRSPTATLAWMSLNTSIATVDAMTTSRRS